MKNPVLKIVFEVEEKPLLGSGYVINREVIDKIARILTHFKNSEKNVILVSAGSIVSGIEKLGLKDYPHSLTEKQAIAALGQVELIRRYQNTFDEYNQMVGQVLLDRNVTDNLKRKKNAKNTFEKLLQLNVIPIINENDTTSTADIEMESNYPLTVSVANIIKADIIVILEKNFTFKIIKRESKNICYIKNENELFNFIEKNEGELFAKNQDSEFIESLVS